MRNLIRAMALLPFVMAESYKIDRSNVDVSIIPDESKQTADFAEKYGYPAESHVVSTEDGYMLTIHRIPFGRNNTNYNRPVVLLQHGIVLTSDQWVLRGPEDLVFLLAEAGYDVWLGNSRGNFYAKHRLYSNKDLKYWDYGLHETGFYDLAAMIDYIIAVTGKPSITYLGHSRGVAMAAILTSSRPEYNSKINLFLGVAPVIYSKYARCPIYELAGNRPTSLMRTAAFERSLKKEKVRNLLYTTKNIRILLSSMCRPGSFLDNVCPFLFFFINGDDFRMFDKTLVPSILSHFTMGVGAKELVHLLQVSESDIFRQYDYGKRKNLQIYGYPEPPTYNLSRITVPTYLYYGPNDLFVSERDLFKFAKQLPNYKSAYRVPYDKFNHLDYIWAKNANELLYPLLLETIYKYNRYNF